MHTPITLSELVYNERLQHLLARNDYVGAGALVSELLGVAERADVPRFSAEALIAEEVCEEDSEALESETGYSSIEETRDNDETRMLKMLYTAHMAVWRGPGFLMAP